MSMDAYRRLRENRVAQRRSQVTKEISIDDYPKQVVEVKEEEKEEVMLTEEQIIEIVEEKRIKDCTEAEKAQVFAFMFGEEYMSSDDKGSIKECSDDK